MKSPINVKHWTKGDVKGIHFTTNGWVISAIMGNTVYSSYNGDDAFNPDCEIALWRTSDNKMIEIENDTVKGWVEWGNVIDLVEWIRVQDETPDEDAVRFIIQTFC
jgi:hypothetical protein